MTLRRLDSLEWIQPKRGLVRISFLTCVSRRHLALRARHGAWHGPGDASWDDGCNSRWSCLGQARVSWSWPFAHPVPRSESEALPAPCVCSSQHHLGQPQARYPGKSALISVLAALEAGTHELQVSAYGALPWAEELRPFRLGEKQASTPNPPIPPFLTHAQTRGKL